MFGLMTKNYLPVSREDHHNKLKAFVESCKGLPPTKYEYKHTISDGVYFRQLTLRRGGLIIGAIHKRETALIMLSGSIKVFSEDGIQILKPPMLKVSPPGTQRAGFALEDSILMTIHRVDSNNLEEIVRELVDYDSQEISGVTEGSYRLYNNGRKVIDEKIQHTSKDITGDRNIQRLLFT